MGRPNLWKIILGETHRIGSNQGSLEIISEWTLKGGNMPIFKTGEMFRASGFLIVSTNSFLTSEIRLVMGKGDAWVLKMKVPGIDRVFGKMISLTCGLMGCLGFLFIT